MKSRDHLLVNWNRVEPRLMRSNGSSISILPDLALPAIINRQASRQEPYFLNTPFSAGLTSGIYGAGRRRKMQLSASQFQISASPMSADLRPLSPSPVRRCGLPPSGEGLHTTPGAGPVFSCRWHWPPGFLLQSPGWRNRTRRSIPGEAAAGGGPHRTRLGGYPHEPNSCREAPRRTRQRPPTVGTSENPSKVTARSL